MGYRLVYSNVNIVWVPDGAGPMEVSTGPVLSLNNVPYAGPPQVVVPGGNTPTLANFNTALTGSSATPAAGSMCADLSAQISAALVRIQGFATGGG